MAICPCISVDKAVLCFKRNPAKPCDRRSCRTTEDSLLSYLRSLGPSAEHHFQSDILWLQTECQRALEAIEEAKKVLDVASYTEQENRASKKQSKANKKGKRQNGVKENKHGEVKNRG